MAEYTEDGRIVRAVADYNFQNRDIFDSIKISFDNLKAMGVK